MRVRLTQEGGFAGIPLHYETQEASPKVQSLLEQIEGALDEIAAASLDIVDGFLYELEIEDERGKRAITIDERHASPALIEALDLLREDLSLSPPPEKED
jgi:hypothetical protein